MDRLGVLRTGSRNTELMGEWFFLRWGVRRQVFITLWRGVGNYSGTSGWVKVSQEQLG